MPARNIASARPSLGAANVTPDDLNDLPLAPCNRLYITTSGTIAVITADGSPITIPVVVGELNLSVKRVKATGTTSTGIIAFY